MKRNLIVKLRERAASFDQSAQNDCRNILSDCSKIPLKANADLVEYNDALLFVIAYAISPDIVAKAEKELKRIASFLKSASSKDKKKLENTGLPFTPIRTRFSHECCEWLIQNKEVSLQISDFKEASMTLGEVLKYTLPPFERDLAAAGNSDEVLLNDLGIPEKDKLSFLIKQFAELNDKPQVKDYFFDAMGMTVQVQPKVPDFSRAFNRILIKDQFYHDEILKKFDHHALLNTQLPDAADLSKEERAHAIDVVKKAMALTARETDPATYLDPSTFKLYHLERGISIAHFTMSLDRKLPLEYYIGFTLFKNGLPASYGGAWIFGKRALFGINVFEAYRGGESGYIMCQLLRSYRQAYGSDYFEVEPYQYGADNPDGIKSGAFWFYYRYGFRPLDKTLNKLASDEFGKIKSVKGYRSSERTLLRFTESNIALNMGEGVPPTVQEVEAKMTKYINKFFKGDRRKAIEETVTRFMKKNKLDEPLTPSERVLLEELAIIDAVHK